VSALKGDPDGHDFGVRKSYHSDDRAAKGPDGGWPDCPGYPANPDEEQERVLAWF
jgi:hypothetical protein